MVKIILMCLVFISQVSYAEIKKPDKDKSTGKFTYQKVVNVDEVSKSDLYSRARAWVATAYRSANHVVQYEDSESGRMIIKGNFDISYYGKRARIEHTLTIEAKSGRYRYTLSDYVFDNDSWSSPLEDEKKFYGQRKKLFKQVVDRSQSLILSLESSMIVSSQVGDDNW